MLTLTPPLTRIPQNAASASLLTWAPTLTPQRRTRRGLEWISGLHDPGAMRHFLAASDYCFGYSDSEGTYDPARECFHIGLGMPRASDADEGAGNCSPLR